VVTSSFNKPKYLAELRQALENQTTPVYRFTWRIFDNSTDQETRDLVLSWKGEPWIEVECFDFSAEERAARCPHPVLLNRAVRNLEGLLVHISDDDLPDPGFLTALVGFLRFNQDKAAAYVPMRCQVLRENGESYPWGTMVPPAPVVFGPRVDPVGNLDGNCVMAKVEALRRLGDPWHEEWKDADKCDGLMLRRFCETEKIWPASSEPLFTHRITPMSAWRNSEAGLVFGSDAIVPGGDLTKRGPTWEQEEA
jgi:hypothetical protein